MTKKPKLKETPADEAVTRAAMENSGARLLEHVEGVESLLKQVAELKDTIKDRFGAAKSEGYDPAALKALIKRRAMNEEELKKQEDLFQLVETYAQALDWVGVEE